MHVQCAMGNGHEIGIWIGTVQYSEAWTGRHAQILMQEADYPLHL
jgi:hypothetical protein